MWNRVDPNSFESTGGITKESLGYPKLRESNTCKWKSLRVMRAMHVGLIINSKHLKELRTSKQYLLVPSSFPTRHILGPGIYLGRKGGGISKTLVVIGQAKKKMRNVTHMERMLLAKKK